MKIAAIIVAYHPDESIDKLIKTIAAQVDSVYLIDNSPTQLAANQLEHCQRYFHLAGNRGVAAAQNCGIRHAIDQGMSHVLLLDQDSEPAPDLIASLARALVVSETQTGREKVAAIGPMYVDKNTGEHSTFLRIGIFRNKRIFFDPKHSRDIVDTDFLISSGCLIPVNVLTDIGMMDESLFIDYVDTEWGLRAKQQGYRLLGASGNLMQHRIGEASQRVWFGRWRQVAVHKSFRYYYIFRNSLILFHRPCAFKWRLFHLKRLLLLFVFIICSRVGMANVRYACAGVRDAIAGRTGPMPGT